MTTRGESFASELSNLRITWSACYWLELVELTKDAVDLSDVFISHLRELYEEELGMLIG
jgi:hypothetical protein